MSPMMCSSKQCKHFTVYMVFPVIWVSGCEVYAYVPSDVDTCKVSKRGSEQHHCRQEYIPCVGLTLACVDNLLSFLGSRCDHLPNIRIMSHFCDLFGNIGWFVNPGCWLF